MHAFVRRPAAVAAALLALMVGGCGGGGDPLPSPPGSSGTTAAAAVAVERLPAPTKAQLARGTKVGDQSAQGLADVASSGHTVVAVGWDDAADLDRPLFAVSTDDGRDWSRAAVQASPDATEQESPSGVVHGPAGWVAYGSAADGRPVIWASADGRRWSREPPSAAFSASDTVSVLRSLAGTYYLFGTSDTPSKRTSQQILMWASRDGRTWTRTNITRRLPGASPDAWVSDAALDDGALVLAGGIEDNDHSDHPDRIALWRSQDHGRTFTKDQTPDGLGGGGRAYAVQFARLGGRLLLAASGGGSSGLRFGTSSWDAVVISEESGRTWETDVDDDFSTMANEHPSTLFALRHSLVMAANSDDIGRDATVGVGASQFAFRLVGEQSLRGPGTQIVAAGAAVGSAAVLVGSDDRSGTQAPEIWRLARGRITNVPLPAEMTEGEPSPYAVDAVASPGGDVVVGTSSGAPVAWAGRSFTDWSAAGLSGKSDPETTVSMSDAVVAGRRVVAVGYREQGDHADGLVWIRDPKSGAWLEFAPTELSGVLAKNHYGYTWPQAVAARGRLVVIAASRFDGNGHDELRPFFSRDGGVTWHDGRGRHRVAMSDDDKFAGRTPWRELRGPDSGDLSVSTVASGSKAWMIGGSITELGSGERPEVWSSPDGKTWRAAVNLPMPAGFRSGSVDDLVDLNGTWVATGSVTKGADDVAGWASWTSTDGRSWRLGTVVAPRDAGVANVVRVPEGLLALGSTGPTVDRDAGAWFSRDGVAWQAVDLGVPAASGPGGQYFTQAVFSDGLLHLIGSDIPPSGGGPYATTVPWHAPS